MRRVLERRGLEPQDEGGTPPDPLAEESRARAGIRSASVAGRVALGRRAGARVLRLGHEPEAPWGSATGPRQAPLEGVDRPATLRVPAEERARLAPRCRHRLRPPVAQDRLPLTGDGRIRRELKRAWADGTRPLLVEPLALLEQLAARPPRPCLTRVLDHGVPAPQSRWRHRAVASEGPGVPLADAITDAATPQVPELRGDAPGTPRYGAWADLMRRGFDLDVLPCPRGGGRMRLLATLEDAHVSRNILAHPGPLRLAPLTSLPTCLPDGAL